MEHFSYLQVLKAEQLQYIEVEISFDWKNKKDSGSRKEENDTDLINAELNSCYQADNYPGNQITSQWNVLRMEVIKILLNNILYPLCHTQLIKEIKEKAEKDVIKECADKFYS